MGFLLFDAPGKAAEFIQGVLEAMVCTIEIDAVDHGSRLSPAPAGTTGDGRHHLQVPQQPSRGRFGPRLLFGNLAASFEKKRRLFENPRSHPRRAVAPGGIQLARLAARELVRGEGAGHLFAIFEIGARHRDEELHGCVRGDLTFTHLLLDRVRQKFDQRQAARNPTDTAVKAAGEFVQPVAEALFEFREQPALLQGGFAIRCPQRLAKQECLGLVHLPHGRMHRVVAQPSQGRDAFVAVDDQVTVGFIADRHDHDWHLLARGCKRGEKPSLAVGASRAQVFEP